MTSILLCKTICCDRKGKCRRYTEGLSGGAERFMSVPNPMSCEFFWAKPTVPKKKSKIRKFEQVP